MAEPKEIDRLSVFCVNDCGKLEFASIFEHRAGVIFVCPPDGWFISSVDNFLHFCCGECATKLGIECGHGDKH